MNQLLSFIPYFPNARFAYINRLIKNALLTKQISRSDYDYLNYIWMNQNAKEAMLSFFKPFVNDKLTEFTIQPIPSRSGLKLKATPNGLRMPLYNPGEVQ